MTISRRITLYANYYFHAVEIVALFVKYQEFLNYLNKSFEKIAVYER